MMPLGSATTDSHGEYRFEEPPGRYGVLLRYSPSGRGTADKPFCHNDIRQILQAGASGSFALGPGEQRKLDMQARTGMAYPVTFRAETAGDRAANFRIVVRAATGESFPVFAQPAGTPGEFHIDLPSGTYSLHGTQQNRERSLEAEGRVTVAGRAVSGLVLRFTELPSIPVQVAVDTSSTGTDSGVQATEGVHVEVTYTYITSTSALRNLESWRRMATVSFG